MDIIILNLDVENRKMSLGHKQLEEDPWDTFESIFPVGSIHQGTIVRKDDKGATIQLQYGLEGYSPIKHLKKENGKNAELDETLDFKILEFEKSDKRILLSHSKIVTDSKNATRVAEEGEKVAEEKRTKDSVKTINEKAKKSTMGDLEALTKLKETMDKNEGK
jgi:small subunit ribosomal protein S1